MGRYPKNAPRERTFVFRDFKVVVSPTRVCFIPEQYNPKVDGRRMSCVFEKPKPKKKPQRKVKKIRDDNKCEQIVEDVDVVEPSPLLPSDCTDPCDDFISILSSDDLYNYVGDIQ